MPAHASLAEQERGWKMDRMGLNTISEKEQLKMCDITIKETNMLKVDERLQLARERREAHQKQLALRELGWLAREERAKQFYKKHLEERRKKLEEQRQKEEQRRMAVEEKRKQRIREERTMEKSQKVKLNPRQRSRKVIMNNKTATRCFLSKREIDLVQRLQTPTVSYLARTRSAVCLSRDTGITSVSRGDLERRVLKKQAQTTATETIDRKTLDNNSVLTKSRQQNRIVRNATPSQEGLPPLAEEHELCSGIIKYEDSSGQHPQDLQLSPVTNGAPDPLTNAQVPNEANQLSDQVRAASWTTDPEEATRVLAEKRKQARLQREKEEEERRQKEDMERKSQEQLVLRRAEERARQEAEVLRLDEEKRKRDEEERLRVEEENTCRQKEEEKKLQLQKEEDARLRNLAEQQRLERENILQREEAERQERKKRLEEIMKRTRKTEPLEKKAALVKDDLPCENTKPVIRVAGSEKTPKLKERDEEDLLPTVAFKERRAFRSLSGLEEVQAHQQTEVI
ncbi:hypothetical protein DNTS_010254 [Danionella cerebrum]|uniref:Uncharacterized protein n=1 Tax=Danionella cerebrum TaxID=2873325 RepID=A0A553P5J6_9TELE|nr:hypothetical protein DNTS_010254 [Danionella translucida]